MKTRINAPQHKEATNAASEEILILADGRVLAHNLTSEMAAILRQLNPRDEPMQQRARAATRQHGDGRAPAR